MMAVHLRLSDLVSIYDKSVSSISEVPRHIILITYRCSLPVLTGFSVKSLRRIETSTPLNLHKMIIICLMQASILL